MPFGTAPKEHPLEALAEEIHTYSKMLPASLERLASVESDLAEISQSANELLKESHRMIGEKPTISEKRIKTVEEKIDNFNKELSSLNSFILPGGSESSTYLHIARTVTRRAERKIVALSKKEKINPITIIYLNRLSDLLFVLARYTNNKGKKDILWKPGKNLKKS